MRREIKNLTEFDSEIAIVGSAAIDKSRHVAIRTNPARWLNRARLRVS